MRRWCWAILVDCGGFCRIIISKVAVAMLPAKNKNKHKRVEKQKPLVKEITKNKQCHDVRF